METYQVAAGLLDFWVRGEGVHAPAGRIPPDTAKERWGDPEITELLYSHESIPQTGAQLMRASSRAAEGQAFTSVFTAWAVNLRITSYCNDNISIILKNAPSVCALNVSPRLLGTSAGLGGLSWTLGLLVAKPGALSTSVAMNKHRWLLIPFHRVTL